MFTPIKILDARREARMEGLLEGEKLGIEKGLAEGFTQGEECGVIKGKLEKARETALAFKKMGLPISQIAKGTGLTEEEIEKL